MAVCRSDGQWVSGANEAKREPISCEWLIQYSNHETTQHLNTEYMVKNSSL